MALHVVNQRSKPSWVHVFVDEFADTRISDRFDDEVEAVEALADMPSAWSDYRYTIKFDANGSTTESMAADAERMRDQWAAERREQVALTRWYQGAR